MKDLSKQANTKEYGMSSKYTYDAKGLKCGNCKNKHSVVKIPKGTTVDDFKLVGECPVCGVKGMLHTPLHESDL